VALVLELEFPLTIELAVVGLGVGLGLEPDTWGGKYDDGSVILRPNGLLTPGTTTVSLLVNDSPPADSFPLSLFFLPKTPLILEDNVVPELLAEEGVCTGIEADGESEDTYARSAVEREGEGRSEMGVARVVILPGIVDEVGFRYRYISIKVICGSQCPRSWVQLVTRCMECREDKVVVLIANES
jgi:hypothetical protein